MAAFLKGKGQDIFQILNLLLIPYNLSARGNDNALKLPCGSLGDRVKCLYSINLVKLKDSPDRLVAAEGIEVEDLAPQGKVAGHRHLGGADIAADLHLHLKLLCIDALPFPDGENMFLEIFNRHHRGKESTD